MKAPMEYDAHKKGFFYTEAFSLPSYTSSANEENYSSAVSRITNDLPSFVGEVETLQMQIPYSAEIEIKNKLGVLELKDFIVTSTKKNVYLCEFHNVEQFLSVLITLRSDFKIVEPMWIRERLVKMAENIIKNNKF